MCKTEVMSYSSVYNILNGCESSTFGRSSTNDQKDDIREKNGPKNVFVC